MTSYGTPSQLWMRKSAFYQSKYATGQEFPDSGEKNEIIWCVVSPPRPPIVHVYYTAIGDQDEGYLI
jgi:hypothetical protein